MNQHQMVFGGAMLLIVLCIVALAIAEYILFSLGLYKLSKQRGLRKPWLSWIPAICVWNVGSLIDQYDAKAGMKRKWRVLLLTLILVILVGFLLLEATLIKMVPNLVNMNTATSVFGFTFSFFAEYLVILLAAVVFAACYSICMYKLFESAVPNKSLKYFIISLLVPLGEGVCLLLSVKQDVMVFDEVEPEFIEVISANADASLEKALEETSEEETQE